MVSLLILGATAILGGGDVWQRIYAADSDQSAKAGLRINALGWAAFGVLFTWIALLISVQLPNADPSTAFLDFVINSLNPVIAPLVCLLVIAAVLSTAEVEVFVVSIVLCKEFARGTGDRPSLAMAKVSLVAVTGLSTVLAVVAREILAIYFLVLYLLSIIGPISYARALNRGNYATACFGLIGGTLMLVVLYASDKMAGWNQLLIAAPSCLSFFFASNSRVRPGKKRS